MLKCSAQVLLAGVGFGLSWSITVGEMQAAFQQEAKNFKQDIEKFNLKLN